jgi:FKBP-type peptidyl-prolyl cis-trans isomerase FkpA
MKISKIVFSVLAMGLTLAACQNVDFKKTSAGIPYKIFSSKSGDSVKVGSIVKYQVIQKVNDSVLYSSYDLNRPEFFQVRPSADSASYTDIKANVEQVIARAKEGDSLYFVQATDSLIKENQNPNIAFKKGDRLITTIKIVNVYKNAEEANAAQIKEQASHYEENKAKGLESFRKDTATQALLQKEVKEIDDYLKAHNIQAEKNEWGIFIQTLTPGQGPKPNFGQYVNLNYKGMHMSGEVFDQGTMPLQIGVSRVVFGFMEGVSELKKGQKARLYIPAILGYGPQGNPPRIKGDENLIFEIEVLDITDTPPSPQQQPNGGQ